MAVTFADIAQIDAAKYELPKDYTPRDVEILQWLFHRARGNEHDLKIAQLEIKTLQEQLKKMAGKKVTELAKPLKKSVNFQDLMNKLLEIHIDEHETYERSNEYGLRVRTDERKILATDVAQMIILLTTYLDKQGVDENGRRKLFEEVQAKKWFGD